MLGSELKSIDDYRKERHLSKKEILKKLITGEVEAFVNLTKTKGVIEREKLGIYPDFIESQNFQMSHTGNQYAQNLYQEISGLFGNARSFPVEVSALCKVDSPFFANTENIDTNFLHEDNLLLECALEIREGKIKISNPSENSYCHEKIIKNKGIGCYFIPIVKPIYSDSDKIEMRIYKNKKGVSSLGAGGNYHNIPVSKLLIKDNYDTCLTIKDILKLKDVKKLDYDAIDIVGWLLRPMNSLNFNVWTIQKDIFNKDISPRNIGKRVQASNSEIKIQYKDNTDKDYKIAIDTIKVISINNAKSFFGNLSGFQTEENQRLINFVKSSCHLMKKSLKNGAFKEIKNFGTNKISIKLLISLLVAFSIVKKRFKPDEKNQHIKITNLREEEKNEFEQITNFLYQELITNKKYPEQFIIPEKALSKSNFIKQLISFNVIQSLLNDNPDLVSLAYDVELAILNLLNKTQKRDHDSTMNFFIARLMVSMIILGKLPQEPIPFRHNDMVELTTLAQNEGITNEKMFEAILDNKINWYVRIRNSYIWVKGFPSSQSSSSGVPLLPTLLPTLASNRFKEIENILEKRTPYFKLSEKDYNNNPTEYSDTLKYKNKIPLGTIYLALPEELKYLANWGVSISIPENGKGTEITLDDIAIPKNEASKFKESLIISTINEKDEPEKPLAVAPPTNQMAVAYELLLSGQDVDFKEVINIFWPPEIDANKNTEVKKLALIAIQNSEDGIKFEKINDDTYSGHPEQLVLWMIGNDLFPKEAFKIGLFRMFKYHLEYTLDNQIYEELPKNKKTLILQLAEQDKIDLFVKVKNQKDTLKIFITPLMDLKSKYSEKELQDRQEAYYTVIKRKTYWKLNKAYFYNYIPKLNQDGEISENNNGMYNSIHFEPSDVEKELGIKFHLEKQKITLDDVFILAEEPELVNKEPKPYDSPPPPLQKITPSVLSCTKCASKTVPDYNHWLKMSKWKFEEAVLLLNNIEPNQVIYREINKLFEDKSSKIGKTHQLLSRAIKDGELSDNKRPFIANLRYFYCKPDKYINWAKHNEISIPEELEINSSRKDGQKKTDINVRTNSNISIIANGIAPASAYKSKWTTRAKELKNQNPRWKKPSIAQAIYDEEKEKDPSFPHKVTTVERNFTLKNTPTF